MHLCWLCHLYLRIIWFKRSGRRFAFLIVLPARRSAWKHWEPPTVLFTKVVERASMVMVAIYFSIASIVIGLRRCNSNEERLEWIGREVACVSNLHVLYECPLTPELPISCLCSAAPTIRSPLTMLVVNTTIFLPLPSFSNCPATNLHAATSA